MIDWQFIEGLEDGGCLALAAYVPHDRTGAVIGHSGVTLGGGVDLGQVAPEEIAGWAISPALKARLKPYAGLRGLMALRTLGAFPLSVIEEEAAAITAAAQLHHVEALRRRYDAVTLPCGLPGLDAIPEAAATVLVSVSFQYGPNLQRAAPRFWRMVCVQGWAEAIAELRDFRDAFPTRRHREAAYLEAALAAERVA